jgi:hypothetical protein
MATADSALVHTNVRGPTSSPAMRTPRYNSIFTQDGHTMSMLLLDQETKDALQQLYGETIEAMELAKKSPDLDDLAATFAVALLKLGLATGFVEQKYPGFAKDVEEKRQRVIAALTQAQTAKH